MEMHESATPDPGEYLQTVSPKLLDHRHRSAGEGEAQLWLICRGRGGSTMADLQGKGRLNYGWLGLHHYLCHKSKQLLPVNFNFGSSAPLVQEGIALS